MKFHKDLDYLNLHKYPNDSKAVRYGKAYTVFRNSFAEIKKILGKEEYNYWFSHYFSENPMVLFRNLIDEKILRYERKRNDSLETD